MSADFSNIDIDMIRDHLARTGYVKTRDVSGKNLYLISSELLPGHPRGVLVAYEGYGAMFFDLEAPINKFQLITKGFTFSIADTLAAVLNAIFGFEHHVTVRMPYRRKQIGESLIETERNKP